MSEITATQVKELRDATNVSMMECKKALQDAGGDMEKATKLLRERGLAVGAKRAGKATNQGVIAAATSADGRTAALVEVNCETDFVARTAGFQAFVKSAAAKACTTDGAVADLVKDELGAQMAALGENIIARRNVRFAVQGSGAVGTYIHLGGKVGVLVEVGCEKPATPAQETFKNLLLDLTLHVAACSPQYLKPSDVPASVVESEKEIYAKQVQGKPPQVLAKIVEGKLRKFYSDVCFLDQLFVKEQKETITQLLDATGKKLGDTLTIRRYVRYQLGA
jgi:elongation factor Ts